MEALTELCDIIAKNPKQFSEKLAWICGRCPQTEWLLAESPRVSRSHLNAVLAVARIISKNPESIDNRAKSVVNEFLSAIPASFRRSFWPHSFPSQLISSFYCDFLSYLSCAADLSPEFGTEVARFTGEVVIAAIAPSSGDSDGDPAISKAFLVALSQHFPSILQSDGDKLITMLLDQFVLNRAPASPKEQRQQNSANSETDTSSSQGSPISTNRYPSGKTEMASPGDEVASHGSNLSSKSSSSVVMNGGSIVWKSGVDQLSFGFSEGSGGANPVFRQQVASFEDESIESLEKQEIAFRLITHILDKVKIDSKLQDQVRFIAKRQLQSMSAFLKSRKRDWNEQGQVLKTRVNAKLSVYQAAAKMKIKSLVSLETDGKTSKRLVLETLALLLDAADACLTSVWRKMKACEELFDSLLSGIAKIAVARGGQPLRVLLIRLKPLPDQGAMLESIFKTSCVIIESAWAKDRAPVDNFIMGLASSIRERNDYEEQVEK
jgi:phosphatidylinositol 4-kinase